MATSTLAARLQDANLSIGACLLSLACGIALAFLLPILLSFLPHLSFLLQPVPIFLLANSLILAIHLSSAYYTPRPAHDSSHSQPPQRRDEFALPQPTDKPSSVDEQRSAANPGNGVPAQRRFERIPVALTRSTSSVSVSSVRTFGKNPAPQVPQKFGDEMAGDPQIDLLAKIKNSVINELKERLAVREHLAGKTCFAHASTASDHYRPQSDCSPRICVGETVETFTNTIQRVDTIDRSPLDLCSDVKSSSRIVIHVASLDSLDVDDDLDRRCDEFIANSREKWKKECLEYGTD